MGWGRGLLTCFEDIPGDGAPDNRDTNRPALPGRKRLCCPRGQFGSPGPPYPAMYGVHGVRVMVVRAAHVASSELGRPKAAPAPHQESQLCANLFFILKSM